MSFRESTGRDNKFLRNKRHMERQQKRTQYLQRHTSSWLPAVIDDDGPAWPEQGYSLPTSTIEYDTTTIESGGGGEASGEY